MRGRKGVRVAVTLMIGLAAMAACGLMFYLFFTLSWLPTLLRAILFAVCGVGFLSALIITITQVRGFFD